MSYWFETEGTIVRGVGFSHFDGLHLCWLLVAAAFTVGISLTYRRLDPAAREKGKKATAAAIAVNEAGKTVLLLLSGKWEPAYLPLHLCSINIFLIAIHAVKPNKVLDNFLYAVCIPGALAALLFPGWTKLPLGNFLHLHSFTIHILLAAYPIMLTAGGDIRPDAKYIPHCFALLGVLAGVALTANRIFGTNFMFLMSAGRTNPLYWFQVHMGSHLWGFGILLPLVILVMYAPWIFQLYRGKPAEA